MTFDVSMHEVMAQTRDKSPSPASPSPSQPLLLFIKDRMLPIYFFPSQVA